MDDSGSGKRKSHADQVISRFRSFRSSTEGSVLPLFAITLLVLIVAGGAGVDYTNAVRTRHVLQNALDAAVLAGAAATEDQIAVAEQYFASNVAGHEGLKPSVEFTVGNDEVTGVASAAVGAWFVHLLGIEAIPVTVSAAAGAETSAVVCIYAVNQLESEGFKANGSGKIDMPDCEMHVHSKTSSATWIDSRHIDTKRLCVAGSLGGNARPWPDEFEGHCDVEDDPIAGTLPALSDELVAEESCVPWSAMPDENATDMVFKPGTYCYYPNINGHVQTVTFEPGDYVFKSGLTFSGKHVVFGAGNYVFKGANFQFNGSVQTVEMGAGVYVFSGGSQLRFDDQKITGTGITIYLADAESAVRTVQGSSKATLSAPETGPYAGILYYEAPDISKSSSFILDGELNLAGIVHLPSRNLHLNGSGKITGNDMILVINKLSLDGWISLTNSAAGSTPGSGKTRLLN
ncbi:TadE/TadG family type IV pilus assembly protein [Roseibium salinum]|uniref:Pilus assembly protein TadG-related protein n=2 Tax=Roseibium salinum TaxID=1604349 RepID=A0ABT3QX02_9HYPH|nr:pilus assembly protein TadG-related protein [Roseibium sp. DSM 29163]